LEPLACLADELPELPELPGDRDYQPFAVGLNYGSLETDLPAWVLSRK
jgi:hypothetical protein